MTAITNKGKSGIYKLAGVIKIYTNQKSLSNWKGFSIYIKSEIVILKSEI
jgi:hypothetical protein